MGRQRQEHCVPSGTCVQGERWKVGGMLKRAGEGGIGQMGGTVMVVATGTLTHLIVAFKNYK